jgi:hypothetical protein
MNDIEIGLLDNIAYYIDHCGYIGLIANDAMTLSLTTHSIMTYNITTFSTTFT